MCRSKIRWAVIPGSVDDTEDVNTLIALTIKNQVAAERDEPDAG
jgi:hypothetical protein